MLLLLLLLLRRLAFYLEGRSIAGVCIYFASGRCGRCKPTRHRLPQSYTTVVQYTTKHREQSGKRKCSFENVADLSQNFTEIRGLERLI